tara:strand:+ start:188 stop:448 length:261 start_codon:yes stop_codon:yes gene_type:complete
MATQSNLVVEYGLTVGTTEVINSSGKLQASAISTLDTDNLSEGSTNLYFTNARARGAISLASGETSLAYNSTSGELSLSSVDGGTI